MQHSLDPPIAAPANALLRVGSRFNAAASAALRSLPRWPVVFAFFAWCLMEPGVVAVAAAREADAGTASPGTVAFVFDVRRTGPAMQVDMIGNASRLNALVGVRSAEQLPGAQQAGSAKPTAEFFRKVHPHYRQFRIGNVFMGYECNGLPFEEMVVRDADGTLTYRFEQTLDMLQMLVDAGIKPHLALTGTPFALVPPGEAVLRHPAYGCVNAPGIDLTRPEPRSRMPEWWQLQDAFIGALIDRFGKEEVQRWTFATWTEPHNPKRKLAHLVLPAELVRSGRHDEAVATVLATSIDVAMKHGVRIRLGNLAGSVETEYPKLVREIAKLPRGKAYLDYVEGYAISRYRTNPAKNIGNSLDAAFTLLKNPAMPDKALFIDELGDLSGDDGADPFEGATGLDGARFVSTALERVFARQNGTPRSPRSVAFWRDRIGPRARDVFTRQDAYLKTPASHVIDMFTSMNGHARLEFAGPSRLAIGGVAGGRVKVILLAATKTPSTGPARPQTRGVTVLGLRPDAPYQVKLTEVGREQGNPISAFLDGAPGYLQDTSGRFVRDDGKWKLASPRWEACFYDEDAACAWRQKARRIEEPLSRGSTMRSDAKGSITTSMVVDEAGIVMIDIGPVQ